jgi:hypothetical protein
VDDFRRNQWTNCVGIGGRFEADYAQTRSRTRLTDNGLRSPLVRLSKKSGLRFSPNILHFQSLLRNSTFEMVRRYPQMVDDDLRDAHREYVPVDIFLKKIYKYISLKLFV